jgi:hypothetical protein
MVFPAKIDAVLNLCAAPVTDGSQVMSVSLIIPTRPRCGQGYAAECAQPTLSSYCLTFHGSGKVTFSLHYQCAKPYLSPRIALRVRSAQEVGRRAFLLHPRDLCVDVYTGQEGIRACPARTRRDPFLVGGSRHVSRPFQSRAAEKEQQAGHPVPAAGDGMDRKAMVRSSIVTWWTVTTTTPARLLRGHLDPEMLGTSLCLMDVQLRLVQKMSPAHTLD